MKRKITLTAGLLLSAVLFVFGKEFCDGALTGIKICGEILIPSVFPFMIAAALTSAGELPPFVKKLLAPVMRLLFRQRADAALAVLIGLFGGYPAGVKSAVTLYKSGKITREEAQRLILFCVNAGAGFCVNAIGNGLLNSRKAGFILLASLCISAVVLGFFARNKSSGYLTETQHITVPFSKALVDSVSSSCSAMLSICAFVILFSGIINTLYALKLNPKLSLLLCCLLEVTSGCAEAAAKTPLPLLAAICAFGGICVHMQIFSLSENLLPDIKKFYLFRVLHSLLSALICSLLLKFFPVELQTVSIMTQNAAFVSLSVPAAVSMLFLSSLLILDLDSNKKIC